MCLIVTIIMFVLSIQNLYQAHWLIGVVQLIISFGFLFLLLRNIRQAQCDRTGNCNSCVLPDFITKLFTKKEKK